jgi:MoaA/NifB/PqqE/SkfB family radical SAM enzyme
VKKYLCSLPWFGIYIDTDGSRKLCCTSQEPSVFIENKFDRNYPFLVQTREQMFRGEKPQACETCWRNESYGIPSMRQGFTWANEKITSIEYQPAYFIDIKVGRECNLACKMCNSHFSSKWDNINPKLGRLDVVTNQQNYNWFTNPEEQHNLRKMLVEGIEFYGDVVLSVAGGEPMLNRTFCDFLVKLPEEIRKKMSLAFVTNGTTIPSKLKDILNTFMITTMNVSIEATSSINDYIRWPSKYSVIEKNIRTFHELGLQVRYLSTIQAYNILNFWEPAMNVDKFGGWVVYQTLNGPEAIDPKNLPKSILDIGIFRAQEAYSKLKDNNAKESLNSVINMLKSFNGGNSCRDILRYSSRFDLITGVSLQQVHPELYGLFQQHSNG